MTYIQRSGQGWLETVDESLDRRKARTLLEEYRRSDPSALYYLSQRPCRSWLTPAACDQES